MDLSALIAQMETRVIAHIDMDCFYCEVERARDPSLRGVPFGVVQYDPFDPKVSPAALRRRPGPPLLATDSPVRQDIGIEENRRVDQGNGSLIAVSYEARAAGVTRQMRGKEAREKCPNLVLVQVPVSHHKSDINLYREAGAAVVEVLSEFATACERSSIDEVYVDITEAAARELQESGGVASDPETWVAGEDEGGGAELSKEDLRNGHAAVSVAPASGRLGGWWARAGSEWRPEERLLAAGAVVTRRMRAAVRERLGYPCSGGISHNKILAKLGSGMHKPDQQTVLPRRAAAALLRDLDVSRLRGLGGAKTGGVLKEQLGVQAWPRPPL